MEGKRDDKEFREIEQELQVELLPGTEVMTDVGSHHFVKSNNKSGQVLIPQPSSDPHDPLNWSPKWKLLAFLAASSATCTQCFAALALGPIFGDLTKAFDCTLSEAVQFSAVTTLVLGFSNFIWVPLSTSFGRRPVYIFSQLLCVFSSIWRARATSYGSFMGASVLNGLAAGPPETIQPAVIADIFFLHDRGKWNTLYWASFMGSLAISPIIAGAMALHVGWRNFWWFNTALLATSLIIIILMFPETKWHRAQPGEVSSGATSPKSPFGVVDSSTTHTNIEKEDISQAEKEISGGAGGSDTASQDPWLGRGKPSKKQWGLYTPSPNALRSALFHVWTPWKLFAFPIVEFASFVVSWSCSSFLIINVTQTQSFAAPPYNWTSQSIGFTNFAILIGTMIGLATAGPLSDWVSARATKRNRGIREPEMRLPAMIPYVVLMYIGSIVVSVGSERKWPWPAVVIIGYTCAGIQVAAIPGIVSTYAVDSYKPVAGSLFVAITVNKNLWGYGLSKFITNWIIRDGFIPPIMTNASLILFWCLFGFLFYFKGKTFRRWSKNSSVHRM